jgi:3-methyl-2-oxobutanoate hydroxymethyltransferase
MAKAGAFSVLVEGVVERLVDRITEAVAVPTIGIGASAHCDGQILVIDNMLGLTGRVPCFIHRIADMGQKAEDAIAAYFRRRRRQLSERGADLQMNVTVHLSCLSGGM